MNSLDRDPDLFSKIETAAHDCAFGNNPRPCPTDAQMKAGNYKKGRVTFHGLPLVIEQPRGSYRTGIDASGKRWTSRMAAHYGYIAGTTGADGDEIDCFIGAFPHAEQAYVINQNVGGRFDEHKVMLGYVTEEDARRAYLDSFDRGWPGLASIVPASLSQLRWWLKFGNPAKPVSPENLPHEGLETMELKRIYWDDAAAGGPRPEGTTLGKLLYDIRRSEAGEDLILDAVTVAEIIEGSDGVLTFDALVTPFSRLERKMEILRGVMDRSGKTVKPTALQITDPFKQMGRAMVAAIFELSDGQTVSVYFHNPDTTPAKLAPADELVSWKWMINKKDITIVAAPERGEDLNVREVARRVMALAEKNSAAFSRANANRAARMGAIQGLNDEITGLEKELATAQHELEVALQEKQDREEAATKAEAERKARAVSGEDLRARAASRGIEVESADTEEDVVQATLVKDGMRASLESVSGRSWKITEIGENYGRGFEVSAEDLGNALDSFAAAATAAAAAKAEAERLAQEAAAKEEADRQVEEAARNAAQSPDAALADVPARFVDKPMIVPPGWISMNAPRPLVGNKVIENGEFISGRFYAGIDLGDSMAATFIRENAKNGAIVVIPASRELIGAMVMDGSKYRDAYMEMDPEERWQAIQGLMKNIQDKPYAEAMAMLEKAKAEADRVATEEAAAKAEVERLNAEKAQLSREMDDELTYARQGTYAPDYLRANRSASLTTYFEQNPEAQAAHEAALAEAVPAPAPDPEPTPEPERAQEDPQATADRALFQSVIDGTAPDMLAPELADQLEAAYMRNESDPEMAALFEQAVNAYQAAMMAATANL